MDEIKIEYANTDETRLYCNYESKTCTLYIGRKESRSVASLFKQARKRAAKVFTEEETESILVKCQANILNRFHSLDLKKGALILHS